MGSQNPVIIWFRHDLRISDHAALSAAAASGFPVIPVYVWDDEGEAEWGAGSAARWWLHYSLRALSLGLERLGAPLVLRRGPVVRCLMQLAEETGARVVSHTRGYDPAARCIEEELHAACAKAGIELKRFAGSALFEPEAIRTRTGEPYRVFTPFWRACQEAGAPRSPLPAPERLIGLKREPRSDALEDWKLTPTTPDWAAGLRAAWQPGEVGGAQQLVQFVDSAMASYASARDRPDMPGTSRLSPYLHFGEVSPRQCWHAAGLAAAVDPAKAKGAQSFLREIGWREFSMHLLFHYPKLATEPFRPEFAAFPWSADKTENARNLTAWQRGTTGYPIVDAGMRELWQTGWMHNRVRMIVASFLCKHLLIPWQEGARWFWDTLVDADIANNQASWQWVAGSGADAAPYFRVFNPILQGSKFDPAGVYVRSYVPEIALLPTRYIHSPWEAPSAVLEAAGVTLGKTYPRPIVDHAAGRARALAAYARLKSIDDVATGNGDNAT